VSDLHLAVRLPGRLHGVVTIATPERSWAAGPGDVVTFGRSRRSTIRLPDDEYISRQAGSVHVFDDFVLVRNDSRTKSIALRPLAGEDHVIVPLGAMASLPYREFSLVLTGAGGLAVVLEVDARELTGPAERSDGATTRAAATVTAPVEITPSQRRVLVALCAPLLTSSGSRAAPATYAQVAQQLALRPSYVRNVVRALRATLSGYGVPGLTADDADGPKDDYRWALARWAVRNGWVTGTDVAPVESLAEPPDADQEPPDAR
jgi:hypothetical protein